jgi:DNA-binding transcriptional LysR family regulator
MSDPRISDFMALLEVVKTSSFSGAAKSLKTSPVNLLNHINKLEAYFQVEIFTRTNRGVFLTKDGERVLEVSKAIVDLLAAPQPSGSKSEERTIITVGASHIPGQYVLPCLISNYQLSNPSIRFDLRIIPYDAIVSQLKEGTLDLASFVRRAGKLHPDEIEVAKDRLVFVASTKHELTRREPGLLDVLRQPLILYEDGYEASDLVQHFFECNDVEPKEIDVRMRLPEPEGLIIAVSEGLGLGLCPEIIAKKSERAGMIRIIQTKDGSYEPYSIIAKRSNRTDSGGDGFWLYLSRISHRFKGNLPCMLKMLYL